MPVLGRAQLTALVASIAIAIMVIELMRRGRLREEYSIMWLLLAFGMTGLSLSGKLLEYLAHLTGIFYPPSALFAVALIGCLVLFMHFSIVISKLTGQVTTLAQEMALMGCRDRSTGCAGASDVRQPEACADAEAGH